MDTVPCTTCRFPKKSEEKFCPRCVATCKKQLRVLAELHKFAGMSLRPGNGGRGSRSGNRTIGLNVDALDFSQGKELVDILSDWKDLLWDELGLEEDFGPFIKSRASSTYSVPNLVNFLLVHFIDLIKNEELAETFMVEIRKLYIAGMKAGGFIEPERMRIKCPSDFREQICNAVLQINESDLTAIVQCRRCKAIRTVEQLLRLMLSIPDSRYWLDAESIAQYLPKLNARKVRYYGKKWHIPKWGSLYEIGKFIERYESEFPTTYSKESEN